MIDWKGTLVPTVGPHHWVPITPPETLAASDGDQTLRPIGTIFFLEDPRARTQHVFVSPKNIRDFHLGTGDETINIYLDENGDGLLTAITVGVHDTTTQSAYTRSSTHVCLLLSLWSYQYKRPFSIYEIKLNDRNHQAVWSIPRFRPKTATLKFPTLAFSNNSPIGSLFALFREGMNATSFAYRFLSYFKITEAWKNNKGPFASLTSEAKLKRLEPTFPSRTVTKHFLGGAYRSIYHDAFLNKKFGWCIDKLQETRDFLAHPFNRASEFTNLDAPEVQAHLGALANLTERIAIQLLEDYLATWEKIDESGLVEQIRTVYSHLDE